MAVFLWALALAVASLVDADEGGGEVAGSLSCPSGGALVPPPRYWIDVARFKSGETEVVEAALEAVGAVEGGKALSKGSPLGHESRSLGEWDVYWSPTRTCLKAVGRLREGQHVCCIPGLRQVTKKSELINSLLRALGPNRTFDIVPRTHSMVDDDDRQAWKAYMEAQAAAGGGTSTWVLKTNAHLAKGLRVVTTEEALDGLAKPPGGSSVLAPKTGKGSYLLAQEYIRNPLLIGGRKFGVRIWVLLSSVSPMRAYISQRGLVLFSTEEYDAAEGGGMGSTDDESWRTRLLTNAAVNDNGAVWTMGQFREYLEEHAPGGWAPFWVRAREIVSSVLASAAAGLRAEMDLAGGMAAGSAFQLLGLDLLLDSAWRPWLLEANGTPSMASKSEEVAAEKRMMLTDLFTLVGVGGAEGNGGKDPGEEDPCGYCKLPRGGGAECASGCAVAARLRALAEEMETETGAGAETEGGASLLAHRSCTPEDLQGPRVGERAGTACVMCLTSGDLRMFAEAEAEQSRSGTFEPIDGPGGNLAWSGGPLGSDEDHLLSRWRVGAQAQGGQGDTGWVEVVLAELRC